MGALERGLRVGAVGRGWCHVTACQKMGVVLVEGAASDVWPGCGLGCGGGAGCGAVKLRLELGWWKGCVLWGCVLLWGVDGM
jgi:hypothetical protein